MVNLAVCMRCGKHKLEPLRPCDQCGFVPQDLTAKAISMYLSTNRWSRDDPDLAEEIERLGTRIRAGQTVDVPQSYVKDAESTLRAIENSHGFVIVWEMFKWLRPVLLIGAIIAACVILWTVARRP